MASAVLPCASVSTDVIRHIYHRTNCPLHSYWASGGRLFSLLPMPGTKSSEPGLALVQLYGEWDL